MKVKDILKEKGPEVATISENKTVQDAMGLLVERKIGSLLVLDDDAKISGIITERDILNTTYKSPTNVASRIVRDVMTKNIIIGEPDDDLEYVESIMTNNRIRHLPIIANKRLAGMISIGDIVKSQLKNMKVENHYLKDYIEGKYPA